MLKLVDSPALPTDTGSIQGVCRRISGATSTNSLKENSMNTYVVLLTMTGTEVEDLDSPLAAAFAEGAPETRSKIESHGGKLVEIYLTMGQFDGVLIAEFPDDIACARAMLALRNTGGVTQTLRAFPESQWGEIAGNG